MADGPKVDWKPQGEGPHPTLAGNTLDPNVKADGAGIGDVSGDSTHQDGIEHIKQNAGIDSSSSSDAKPSFSAAQPPASNPGAEDATGGIASGSGGTSSAAHVLSPVTDQTSSDGGILGTVKSYLGLGGGAGSTEQPVEARNVEDYSSTSASGSSGPSAGETAAGAAAGAGALGAAGGAAAAESSVDKTPSTTDPASQTEAGSTKPTDSDVTTGSDPAESADSTTDSPAMTTAESKAEGGEEAEERHEKKLSDKDTGSKRENRDAIPTAGGEKLGVKHWGESKIVPDNPKPQDTAGVSSEDGQPTSEVKSNTAANTGGAAPPGQSSSASGDQDKEKLVDKLKNKLHIGHKDK